MRIKAYFLNSEYCEGKITKEPNNSGILLCETLSAEKIGKEIVGAVAGKFSGVLQNFPVAITSYTNVLEDGDFARFVDGWIELCEVECRHVVSAFIKKQDKILLLKRSEKVGTFQGLWATVSGYIEEGETPLLRAKREIREETGIINVRLLKKGDVVLARSGKIVFAVHPFLFETEEEVTLDWEHSEYRWIAVEEINTYHTVPKLSEALRIVTQNPAIRHLFRLCRNNFQDLQ